MRNAEYLHRQFAQSGEHAHRRELLDLSAELREGGLDRLARDVLVRRDRRPLADGVVLGRRAAEQACGRVRLPVSHAAESRRTFSHSRKRLRCFVPVPTPRTAF